MQMIKQFLSFRIVQPALIRHLYSHTPYTKDLPKSINETTLVGMVANVVPISFDRWAFFLRTYDDRHFYDVHKVIVQNFKNDKMPKVSVGQKVFVSGKIRIKEFRTQDDKPKSAIEVNARQVYICDTDNDNDATKITDQKDENEMAIESTSNILQKDSNHVELFDQICFDIVHSEKFCYFSIANHFYVKDKENKNIELVNFFPIFVYDNELRDYIQNNLKRLDRVRVEGQLKYKQHLNELGKKQYSGYISANKIIKMVSIHKIAQPKKTPSLESLDIIRSLE